LLNLLWIPEYGGRGAAMATNVSYTVGSIGYMFAYARIVKVPLIKIITYKKSDFTQIRQLIRGLKK
jgi:Na+-driven multidrug efflux pump